MFSRLSPVATWALAVSYPILKLIANHGLAVYQSWVANGQPHIGW
jgi:hypothetical protein